MTISTDRTYNPDIGAVLRMAFRRAGILNEYQTLSPAQATTGREDLESLVEHLQVEGVAARVRTFELVTLVSGTRDYTLTASTLDVEGDGAFIPAGETVDAAAGETPIQPMTIQEWQSLSTKDAQSRPFRYYLDRTADLLVVKFWPTPSDAETGASVRFVVNRLRANNLDANATMDLERYWREYIIWALAERIAFSRSRNMGRVAYCAQRAEQVLKRCRSAAAPQVATGFRLGHRTAWSR